MKQTATVVSRDGKLMAEVARSEACGNCRACKYGAREKVYVDLPAGAFREGDAVELELSDARFSLAALIAYGVPVASFFAGLFAARALTDSEAAQALSALLATGLSLLIIYIVDKRGKASGKYAHRARPCRENGGEYGGNHDSQGG